MASEWNSRNQYLLAVVLGTSLAAGGADAAASDISPKAINNISRYCTACWRNARVPADSWGDCTQEVFGRLLQRLPSSAWEQVLKVEETSERKEFIRAIDAVKKRYQRSRWHTALQAEAIAERGQDGAALRDDREAIDHAAGQVLTPRQQEILRLSFAGHQVSDIAQILRLAAERVSDEKYKAIQKLRGYFGKDAC